MMENSKRSILRFLWCIFVLTLLYGVKPYAYLNNPLPKNIIIDSDESLQYILPVDTFKSTRNSSIFYTISSSNDWVKRGVGSDVLRSGFYYFKPKRAKVIQEKYALFADTFFGLRIFDISESSNPTLVSELNLQGDFYDIDVQGDFAVLSSGDRGMYVVDISELSNPQLVSDYSCAEKTRGIIAKGDHVIVAEYDVGFRIVDISTPSTPLTSSVGESGITSSYGVFLDSDNDLLYVAANSDGLLVYNVSNPVAPSLVGSLAMSQCADVVVVNTEERIAYMAGYPNFRIVDVSDITDPKLVSSMNVAAMNSRSVSKGHHDYVYTTTSSGFKIMNVTNKSSPFIVGEISTTGLQCSNIEILDDDIGILSCFSSGMRIVDSSVPTNPQVIGEYGMDCDSAVGVVIEGNIAYIADASYLVIVNVEDPGSSPVLLSSTEFLYETYGLAKWGSYLYVVGSDLVIIGIGDPQNPVLMETYSLPTRGYDVEIIFDTGKTYALVACDSPIGVDIVDVTDVGNPTQSNFFALSSVANEIFVVEEQDGTRIVYIANNNDGLVILNMTDLQNPAQLSVVEYAEVTRVYGVYVLDNIAYLATFSRLYIVNVTNVYNPEVIGQSSETSLQLRSVAVIEVKSTRKAYIGSKDDGLFVYDVTDPTSPKLNRTYWMNSEIVDVVMSEGYVYAASTYSGLAIFGSKQLVLYDEWGGDTFMCGNVSVLIEAVDSANKSVVAKDTIFVTKRFNRSSSSYCGGKGECFNFVECDCDEGWTGMGCSFFECFDVSSEDTGSVCSGHGDCLSYDECLCDFPDIWYGPNCQYHYCFGIGSNNVSKVCGGHGTCVEKDQCLCYQGYASSIPFEECDLYYCNEILFSDTQKVCSGRGTCVDHNTCSCDPEYEGEDCETWSCGGIEQSDRERSCNGKGDCVKKDECSCNTGFAGQECEVNVLLYSVLAPLLSLSAICFLICLCSIFSLICCLCLCGILIFCLSSCGLAGTVVKQKAGIRRFKKLKNFNLLLREQQLEELDGDEMSAKLRFNKKLFEIDMDDLNTESVIGTGGSSSIVFRAIWRGKIVAFKCFKTRNLLSTQDNFDEFEKEVEILSSVSHPNIIRFFGACLKPPRVGIVMEFCEKGEILNFVQKFREMYDSEYPIFQKIRFLEEITSALDYLHIRGVIHRDLKCENVLVSEDEVSKLMDFGLSKAVERMSAKMTMRVGTSLYMAPEIIISEKYDSSCDVFSFAILAYILLTENDEPYSDLTKDEFRIELSVANDPNFRPNVKKNLKLSPEFSWMEDLIVKCWSHNPKDRYNCKQIRETLKTKGDVLEFMKKERKNERFLVKGEKKDDNNNKTDRMEVEEDGKSSNMEKILEENKMLKDEVKRLKGKLKKFEKKRRIKI